MPTSIVASKGRITIPAAVRKAMQVHTGDRIEFVEIEWGRYEIVAAKRPVSALKGIFGKPRQSVTVEQMKAAIAAAAAGK